MNSVRVRVPASSANLGPGFDSLGLAFNLYNFVTAQDAGGREDSATAEGCGADKLSLGPDNIALIAARLLLKHLGHDELRLHLHLENAIPLSRGLGSSAAARVGALVGTNHWLHLAGRKTASIDDLLQLANQLEGHPDNVAAALLGGLTVSAVEHNAHGAMHAFATQVPVPNFPRFLVFIPDSELATSAARAVLPDNVFLRDAVFNITRTALLLGALTSGNLELLRPALQDKLHQEHRAQLMPGLTAMLQAAKESGAYGATLSGAGPTVLAWIPPNYNTLFDEVRTALITAANIHEVFGECREVTVDLVGCRVG